MGGRSLVGHKSLRRNKTRGRVSSRTRTSTRPAKSCPLNATDLALAGMALDSRPH